MTVRRFPFRFTAGRLEIAGMQLSDVTVAGVIETTGEITEKSDQRGSVGDHRPAPDLANEPQSGRPSYDRLLGAAVAACELDPRKSVPARARQVLEQLALAGLDPADVPSQRTVEEFLRKPLYRNSTHEKRRPRRK